MDLSSVTSSFPSITNVQQSREPANTEQTQTQKLIPINQAYISSEGQDTLALAQSLGVEDLNFSPAELKRLDNLFNAADSILGISELPPLSTEQQSQLNTIDSQIDKIFTDTKDQELSPEQEKQLDELFSQSDKILGFNEIALTDDQAMQIEAIDTQIEKLFAGKIPGFAESDFSAAEDNINQQLDETFGYNNFLNESQHKQADNLIEKIDSLYSRDSLSSTQEDKLDQLFKLVDQLIVSKPMDS